ncbi:MAG: hypothetical protein M3N52_02085, partial [Actinomycetota bacterium]|nr:hypothetical protein [Actinomycetota bacterium]
ASSPTNCGSWIWFGGDTAAVADPVDSFGSVSRLSLRHVLLAGLADIVHFDKTFTHYRRSPDGQLTAHFADGGTASCDVLVGADGGNSRVRRQYLPHAERIETGVTGIQGKVWLTDEIRALVPARLPEGPACPRPGSDRLLAPDPCAASSRPAISTPCC